MLDKLEENIWEKCREVILEDAKLREIDAEFYNLLDRVENEVVAKLEEAYLEYGARVIELAYLQGMKDTKEK